MNVTLETLEMTDEERRAARAAIEELAYRAWEKAGRADDDPLRYWREAELHWIGFHYVPHHYPEPSPRRLPR